MTIHVDTRIDSVRLYRTGAVVTRRAQLAAVDLDTDIRVVGLPLALDDSTLRFVMSGGAQLSQVRVGVDLAGRPGEALPLDERALRELGEEEAILRADLGSLGRSRAAIEKVGFGRRPVRTEGEPPPADVKARSSLLRVRREALAQAFAEERKLMVELDRVVKRRKSAQDELAKVGGSRPIDPLALRKTALARLHLAAELPAPLELELSYFVPGALWAPSYVLRIAEANKSARLEVRAVICQSTGEDWTDVAVSFATAEAMRFHELCELTRLRVGRAQAPPKKRAYRPIASDPRELFADYDRAFGSKPEIRLEAGALLEADAEEVATDELGASDGATASFDAPGMGAPAFARASVAAGAPPPQAMSMAMPMSMSMPAAMAPPASRSKGGFFAGGGGAERAAPQRARRSLLSANDAPAAAAVAEELPIELNGRLFSFESLRMAPPDQQSGRLESASRTETYIELSQSLSLRVSTSLSSTLAAWRHVAERALATDPPRGHVLPHGESGFHHVVVGEHRVDVPSDGAFHSLPVLHGDAPLAIRHVVVPRESTDVFRVAAFDNPLASPLLRGPCDVYVGGEFLLTVEVPTTPTGSEVRVGLGVDQAIKVSRNTQFSESTQGLMGGTLLLKHRIAVEAISHRKETVDLEVRERVPVAPEKEEDIKIEVGEVSPAWQKWEAPAGEALVRGGFAWRVRIEPQVRTELSAAYTVRIPAKLELVGGNRRE